MLASNEYWNKVNVFSANFLLSCWKHCEMKSDFIFYKLYYTPYHKFNASFHKGNLSTTLESTKVYSCNNSIYFFPQQISLRWTYKLMWQEPRMILNASADWSTGEINVRGDMINNFWTPDIIIHDLVNFNKPEILNQVAALEIKDDRRLYYKVR